MKGIYCTLFSIAILLGFSACSFGVPSKISVETDAEYNFCVGNVKQSLDDQFDVDKVFNSGNLGDIKLYDYYPEKKDAKVKQFLTKIPFQEIPIDVSAFFSNSDLSAEIENLSFTQSVDIPDFKLEYTKVIDNDTVNSTVNSILTVIGKTGIGEIKFSDEADFEKVIYERGSFLIKCPDITDNSKVTLSCDGKSFSGTFSSSGEAIINFENFCFKKNGTYLEFEGPEGKDYAATIGMSSKVKEAFGITVKQPVSNDIPLQFKIPVEDPTNSLEYCIVDQGLLITDVKFPSNWTGYSFEYDINSTGSLSFSSPKSSGMKKISLHDNTISPGEIDVDFNFYFSFNHAYLDLSKNASIDIGTELNSFKEISVSSDYANQRINKNDDFPDEIIEVIKEIMLKSSGISGTYTNTFPPDNDISILVNSDFLGIENKSETLKSNVTNGKFDIKSPENTEKVIKLTKTPAAADEYKGWDFSVDMTLPGYSSSKPDKILLKNVVPGKKYELSINVETKIDWDYVIIDAKDTRQENIISLGIDTGSLLENMKDTVGTEIADKINFSSLPLYLMAEKPVIKGSNQGVFDDAKFTGHIKLLYGKKDGSNTITPITDGSGHPYETVLVDSSSGSGHSLAFVSAPEIKMEGNTVITDLKNVDKSIESDLSDILNKTKSRTDGELFIDYDLTFSNGANNDEIKISKDMLDIEDKAISIRVYAYLVLPLKFKVSDEDDLEIDIMKMFSDQDDKDILGRDGPTDLGDIEDYIKVIDKCSLVYDINQLPFYAKPSLELRMDFFNDGNIETYTAEKGSFDMKYEQISNMFKTYPFTPKATLALKKGAVFSLPREISVDLNLAVKVNAKGKIDILGGDK